jgi:bifunctional UDP-N-acetylglucosamine pyrophosphorylase/glucosamine-1-phosphate N-acetyltransferase
MSRVQVEPAAGVGSRLRTSVPKVLVAVNGQPMLDYLLALYASWVDSFVVVVHPSFAEQVRSHTRAHPVMVEIVEQRDRTGMLDAVLLADPIIGKQTPDEVWVTWGDQVGVLPSTVQHLAQAMSDQPMPALALPTVRRRDPYTHFERDPSGAIARFLQRREGDAMPEVGESDMGLFAMPRGVFERQLPDYARTVTPGHATGERNFVPFVPWMALRGRVLTFPCTDEREALGINTPEELRVLEAWLRSRSA